MKVPSEGRCLCGEVTWEVLAVPYAIYNCHCRMCQKIHGASFGTYCFVRRDEFRWTGPTDAVVGYQSSEVLNRSACRHCGSVVPYAGDADDHWVTPAGCHDDMRQPDYNIFVADNSPWHTISGGLPECDAYPDEAGIPSVDGIPVATPGDGATTGSCLCGSVTYEISGPFTAAYNCHCDRCQKARAAAHATNGIMDAKDFRFTSGEELLTTYRLPKARYFAQVFCTVCSSKMPRVDDERDLAIVPLSSLDVDPGVRPEAHIFVEDKASWHVLTDSLTQHAQRP